MFTRMAMGILFLVIMAGAIGSLALGIMVGKAADSFGCGFLITIIGWAATMLSSWMLGVIVELANNVLDCKQFMQQIAGRLNSIDLPSAGNESKDTGKSVDPRDLLKGKDEFWQCPECGTMNESFRYNCKGCGAFSSKLQGKK